MMAKFLFLFFVLHSQAKYESILSIVQHYASIFIMQAKQNSGDGAPTVLPAESHISLNIITTCPPRQ